MSNWPQLALGREGGAWARQSDSVTIVLSGADSILFLRPAPRDLGWADLVHYCLGRDPRK